MSWTKGKMLAFERNEKNYTLQSGVDQTLFCKLLKIAA